MRWFINILLWVEITACGVGVVMLSVDHMALPVQPYVAQPPRISPPVKPQLRTLAAPVKPAPKPRVYTAWELDTAAIVAYTIWLESRGEPSLGQKAVATVIWNCADGDKHLFFQAVSASRKFSCWDYRSPRAPSRRIRKLDSYRSCERIALAMVSGRFKPLDDWDQYFNPEKSDPYWRHALVNTRRIGHHIFGRHR